MERKASYVLDKNSVWAQCALILMVCSIVFRLIGSIGKFGQSRFMVWQLILPLSCCLLFVLCITVCGKKCFWLSFLPTAMGTLFFIIRAMGYDSIMRTVIWTVICVAGLILYTCTVFGVMGSKWFLPPLFGLPFVYSVVAFDIPALRDAINPPTFSAGMLEMSALCIILGMFFISLGITRKTVAIEEIGLPKMKAPVVKAPNKHGSASAEAQIEPDQEKERVMPRDNEE